MTKSKPVLDEGTCLILKYATESMARKMGDKIKELGNGKIDRFKVMTTYYSDCDKLDIRAEINTEPEIHSISMIFKVIDGNIVI